MLTHPKTLTKLKRMEITYESLIFRPLASLSAFEVMDTTEHLRAVPTDGWQGVSIPAGWGEVWSNSWFKTTVTLDESLAGKRIYLRAETGAVETMLWVDGIPRGIFSKELEVGARGYHHTIRLGDNFSAGEHINVALECYAGHPCIGTHPMDARETPSQDPNSYKHTFSSASIVERDELVKEFVFDLKTLNQLADTLPASSFRRGSVIALLESLFDVVPQCPGECAESTWRDGLTKARELMAPELAKTNGSTPGLAGIIGHSHMDTAWLWTTEETIRKCARTYSNALNLMEQYDEYLFVQSSTLHLEQMRDFYPAVYDGIKQRIAEGRWEPNGASFIEADGNIPGGEAQIRQFTRGMAFLEDEFDYTPDTYWLPDTFGYSASLPQIIKGCGLKYFCTTKLSWNETNTFPHDSFRWQGIDGSEIVAHFNETHCWPDPATLINRLQGIQGGNYAGTKNSVRHTELTDRRLIAYGFGDGGGGPMYEMLEMGRRVADLEGVPKAKNMRVGDFMDTLVADCPHLPLHCGELYLELHRGTLTHQHQIKWGNRKLESALRTLELIDVLERVNGATGVDTKTMKDLWEILLVNQFHDILPGTSIPEAHDKAIRLYDEALSQIKERIGTQATGAGDKVNLLNPVSWASSEPFSIAVNGLCQTNSGVSQMYDSLQGETRLMISDVTLPALGTTEISLSEDQAAADAADAPCTLTGGSIETPFYSATLDASGGLTNVLFKPANRRLDKGSAPLNQFLFGEDLPAVWDNWDIDVDQKRKLSASVTLKSSQVVSNGATHLRVRNEYSVGIHSTIQQDMVFYAHSPRIDFDTHVDWQETHSLLKVAFDLDIFAQTLRSEVGFGFVDRATHNNTSQDRATFEVSQHKYSDLSESRFGVAILNDCKYAITAYGSELHLSLLKSGGHPDPRGDKGVHDFTYSLLPHDSGFDVPNVVQPAHALNHPPIAIATPAKDTASLASVDCDHVIIESIKWADNGKGYVLRLYEAERNACQCTLTLSQPGKSVTQTDMRERNGEALSCVNGVVELSFRPFEIKTVYVGL